MRQTERRLRKLEAAFAEREAGQEDQGESAIDSEGNLYSLKDVVSLTHHWKDGRNKEYLRGEVSIAELAIRAGIEPCGTPLGDEVTDQEYREMLLEDEEFEAKGWTLCFVDGDVNRRMAWYAWQENKWTLVSEVGLLKDWTPEKIAELEKKMRRKGIDGGVSFVS